MTRKLTPNERRQVHALSAAALDTIRHWERDPASVREASRMRIEAALAQLEQTPRSA